MRKFWRVTLAILAILLVAGGYVGYRTIWGKPLTFNNLLDRQAIAFLLENPQTLTSVGLVDGTFLDFHSGKLNEYSLDKRKRDYDRTRRDIAEIKNYADRASLSPQEQTSYDMALYLYNGQLAFEKFDWLGADGDLYPVNQLFGIQNELPNFMQFQHVVRNSKTARNYVLRLQAIGPQMDRVSADIARQASLGVIPPDFVIDKSLAGIQTFLAPKPEDHPLVAGFIEKLAKVEGLDPKEKERLKNDAIAAVRDGIYPAYRRLVARLQELRPQAVHDAGVWRLPNGDAYYAERLRQQTTTDMTPDEIHNFGLSEVKRITAEMDALLKAQGLAEGTVGERMDKLRSDPRFLFQNTDADRARVLQTYRDDIARVMASAPQYFSRLPGQPVEVRPVPDYAKASSAGAYYNPPAFDGSRPGVVFVNLRDVSEIPLWGIHTIAFHEGVPGHHFQIALAQKISGLPFLRRAIPLPAFAEGWALYAENFAYEMGLYDKDPYGDLGRLQAELFRATRLVVDTGMHAKRWSREQAIEYMRTATGMAESDVTAEVERYAVMPGQACAYKIGMKVILEAREKAKAELGDRFDIKAFHAAVLLNGALPLGIFQESIDRWIAEEKAKGS